jgi:hypothetical protein
MPSISYIENPRRRRRRHARRLTAAQLAAGFGGRRSMSHRRHRRRNPVLASLAANPRRRRHHRRFSALSVRRYRRHRNPMFGGVGGVTSYFDFKSAAYVAGGIVIAKAGPGLLTKIWPGAPTTGFGLYAVQLGSAVAGAMAVKFLLKSPQGAKQVAVGGIGYVLYQLANDYILPKIGLAGFDGMRRYVTGREIAQIRGYQPTPARLMGYQTNVVPAMGL